MQIESPSVSTTPALELTEPQRRLLEETPNAILATIGTDHQPQVTPVWFLWDGVSFLVSVNTNTVKAINIRRDPRVTLCIDSLTLEAAYVQVVGRAAIEPDERDDTMRLIAKYREAEDLEDHWEMIREGHLLLRIEPLRWQWFDESA